MNRSLELTLQIPKVSSHVQTNCGVEVYTGPLEGWFDVHPGDVVTLSFSLKGEEETDLQIDGDEALAWSIKEEDWLLFNMMEENEYALIRSALGGSNHLLYLSVTLDSSGE